MEKQPVSHETKLGHARRSGEHPGIETPAYWEAGIFPMNLKGGVE